MSELAIQYIRKSVQKGCLDYSQHVLERMLERGIEDYQVVECILKGDIIEIQKFESEDVKVLFQEATECTPEIYVVIAASYPNPVVATVCKFNEEAWECVNGIIRRRKDHD